MSADQNVDPASASRFARAGTARASCRLARVCSHRRRRKQIFVCAGVSPQRHAAKLRFAVPGQAWQCWLVIALTAVGPTPAVAQTWTGQTSNDWTTGTNWIPGGPPSSGEVTIDTQTPNPTVLGVSGPVTNAMSGKLAVGATSGGSGSLTIQMGSQLTTTSTTINTSIGEGAGSTGTVLVTGTGSQWTVSGAQGLLVGNSGTGTLTIENHGLVRTSTVSLAPGIGSMGTVNINSGGVLEAGIFGTNNFSAAIVNIDGGTVRITQGQGGGIQGFGNGINIGQGGMTYESDQDNYMNDTILKGVGAFTKKGTGTLTIVKPNLPLFANTFSGGMNVDAGTVRAGDLFGNPGYEAFGTGLVAVNAGAVLDLNGYNQTVGGLWDGVNDTLKGGSITLGSATLTLNQNATTTFSGVISGGGSLVKNGSGALTLAGANTYTGPTTVNAGALVVGGSITSNTTVAANAFLGGGFGVATITGNLINNGTVAPGLGQTTPGAHLTVNGNYTGNGGTLSINATLGAAGSADQLIINSGSATGSTGVVVNNFGGGGLTTGNGIPVVVAQNGATTTNAFHLGGIVAGGAFQYQMFQGPVSTGTPDEQNTWYLRNSLIPTPGPGPGPGPNPPAPPIPLYRPEVPLYASMAGMARSLNMLSIGTFHERNGDQGLVRNDNGTSDRIWGRVFGQSSEFGHRGTVDGRFDGHAGGVQSGADIFRLPTPTGESRFGLFGGYAQARGDVSGFALGQQGASVGNLQVEAYSVGGYWTHMGAPGWYIDAVVMGSRFEGDGRSINQVGVRTDGYGATASLEIGYPIALGAGIHLEPQGQLVYQHLDFDDHHDGFSSIAHDTSHALAGRLGLRLSADTVYWGARVSPFLKANVWQDWTGTDKVVFAAVDVIEARQRGTSVEVGGGLTARLANNIGLWASADYTTDVAGEGEREIVRGNLGLRVTW